MKTRISIDIGSRNIHIAEGGFQKGQLSLRRSQSFEIPEGCISEEAVKDAQLLADTVANSLKAGKFRSTEAILTVNASHAVIRELDFPQAKPRELDSMVKNEMYQTFHIAKTDVIQYKEIGKTVDADGERLKRYRVAAVDQGAVEAWFSVMNKAKLKAAAMDLNINAIDKLLSWADSVNDRSYGDEAVMLLDFGQSLATLYIVSKGRPVFHRHINISSGSMDSILMSAAQQQAEDMLDGAGEGPRKGLPKDAREIKEKTNIFGGSAEAAPYYNALQPFFYRLNDEIRKVAAFYNDRSQGSNIACIYLFGKGSEFAGLPEYLSGSLSLPVEKLRSVGRKHASIKVEPAHLNAVAALIRIEK
ncbi:MAG TPA: pilus assembly protein PilM [Anaerovoracaceae bacterium]|nr:pilus assembly protein PilM [Anaerovoracaceae bacterium]